MKPKLHPSSVELLQSTPGNSKLLGKSMKVPVIGSWKHLIGNGEIS